MTEFEDRLRAAMQSSMASEQPPPGLTELVRRRHRRHLARLAVATLAVVIAAAAAITPARSALLGRGAARVIAPSPAAPGASHAAAAARQQYYRCRAQTQGALGPHWRRGATHAGPIWFINGGVAPDFRFRNPDGTLKAVPIIVLVRDSTTVSVTPQGAGGRYFRFLPGFGSTNHYTLRDGTAEATFVSCPDRGTLFGGGLTEYYIGILVAGARCVPVDVRAQGGGPPAHASLRFGRCSA